MKPSKASVDARMPPGQSRVSDFPMLNMGIRPQVDRPHVDPPTWSLRWFGLVGSDIGLDWNAFMALPQTEVALDMHCVTRFSQLYPSCEGVLARDWVMLVEPTDHLQVSSCAGSMAIRPIYPSTCRSMMMCSSRTGYGASHSRNITAGRHAWWWQRATLGKAQNGFPASRSTKKVARAVGQCAAITTTPTRGKSSGLVFRQVRLTSSLLKFTIFVWP